MPQRMHIDSSQWTFADDRLITPNRCEWLATELIARAFHHAQNIHDFASDWVGWRVRGQWLIAPNGKRVNTLRMRYWLQFGGSCIDCAHRPRTADEERQLSLPFQIHLSTRM